MSKAVERARKLVSLYQVINWTDEGFVFNSMMSTTIIKFKSFHVYFYIIGVWEQEKRRKVYLDTISFAASS